MRDPSTRIGRAAISDVSTRCHMCNNEGKEGGCPRCGATPKGVVTSKVLNLEVPTELIPTVYQGKVWEKPVVEEGAPLRIQQFDNALEKVYNKFLTGEIPNFSLFLGAPPKSNKTKFAYCCMQTAIAQRFTVAPLLSTSDWRRLQKVSQMNPFYKLYGKYKWDDLIALDVLFTFVDHSDERFDEIPLMKSMLDTRAAFGLSTFIISDYKLNDLVPRYDQEAYSSIYNPDDKRDYRRYPVVLHRF